MPGDISGCFNWQLIQRQWVGAKKLLKMKIKLRLRNTESKLWEDMVFPLPTALCHSTARGTVGTQIQDKWMYMHMEMLVIVNF